MLWHPGPTGAVPAAGPWGVAMHVLPLVRARAGRRPGIPALVAVALLVSLLALPAAATDQGGSGGGAAVPKLAWPGHDGDRHLGPFDRRTANTVLVVGNRKDPRPATRTRSARRGCRAGASAHASLLPPTLKAALRT